MVIVDFLVGDVEAGVDAAVLLRDLRIVKVCGGSHGGGQLGERLRGRPAVSSGVRGGGDECRGRNDRMDLEVV